MKDSMYTRDITTSRMKYLEELLTSKQMDIVTITFHALMIN